RRRHTRFSRDWSSDVCSSDLSLQLLRYAGATGGLEYFLLIVWELLFITSSFLLDRAFKQGKYGEWQLWLPFVMGLAFIEASNVVGMAANLAGLLIGGSTFLVLLCLKWMLVWQLKHPSTKPTPTTEMLTQTTMVDYNKTAYADIARLLQREGEKVGEKTGDETAVEPLKRQRFANVVTDEKPLGKQEKTPRGTNQPKREKTSTISPKRKARIIEMARKWHKENGKLPGRVNLSKVAKCSEYEARKVLEQLKAEFEQHKAS